ncbi:Putative acetyl-CoA synthetase [Desulfonema limicola]|uniref:Acetyl-CoA synthetase n=1 Tax=Desulfonema limicola TaxID=45656 RepID=A0A975GJ14_9BACT|nr:bifunctional acetate--CoA ligase family protein/GNAT family N-acetyltransferase [Desulfonema limicola]QTA83036.1 Putative acetyl-CoA synthetase [Desulfonema limicola]
MSIYNLDKVFQPESIAVIGASEKKGNIGGAVINNLISGEFQGKIFPVHPNNESVFQKPAFKSINDISENIDLAVIAVPINTVPGIIKQCVLAKTKGAVILSGGGKETGEKGRVFEKAILEAARDSELRIIGPNCVGIANTRAGLNASFASRHMPVPGKIAFVSQSGAVCTCILDLAAKKQIGFSHFVSLGSTLDVDFGDMIDYLGTDYNVGSIVLYVESLTFFRKFMSAARAVSRVKPVIVFKAGRSQAGAAAASSHTGAMAGEDAVYDAAFARAGILRVKTFEELFDCSEFLAKQPRPRGAGLAIITNAGGPGVMAADALSDYGHEPARLSDETIAKLNEILPPHWSRGNPVDIIGDASPERYCKTVEICLKAPEINGLLIMMAPQALSDASEVASALADILKTSHLPVFTAWIGGTDVEKGRDIFNKAGIPGLDTPERAVRAFMDLWKYSKNIEMLQEIPSKLSRKQTYDYEKAKSIIQKGLEKNQAVLTEIESKYLLKAYGIPVNPIILAASASDAWNAASRMGFPVVLKIHSPDISHKTDAGGVELNLDTETDVYKAYQRIIENAKKYNPDAEIQGVTIQPMIKADGYELIMGAKKDRDFGPVILFGMGGVMTELLQDRAIALPPLNRLLARRLMEKTRIYRLVKGFRNYPPINSEMLEEVLIRLSQLVTDFPEIEELDINPLIAWKDNVCAIDARVVIKASQVTSPLHLAVSPYPSRYEFHTSTHEGIKLFIRPIRPEDAFLFTELFNSLSQQSIYFRFFSPIRQMSSEMLARFTQIDYDRQIALVAIHEDESGEHMLGAARIILERDPQKAEFAVMINENYQGQGIGAELLRQCLNIANERGIKKVWGIVLPENRQMLKLGKKLNFNIKHDFGNNEYLLSLDEDGLKKYFSDFGNQDTVH